MHIYRVCCTEYVLWHTIIAFQRGSEPLTNMRRLLINHVISFVSYVMCYNYLGS